MFVEDSAAMRGRKDWCAAVHPESRLAWDLTVALGVPEAGPWRWPEAWLGRDEAGPTRYRYARAMLLEAVRRLKWRAAGAAVAPLPLTMRYDGSVCTLYVLGVHAPTPPLASADVWRAWWCAEDDAGDLGPTRRHCGHTHASEKAAAACAERRLGVWAAMTETAAVPVEVFRG